jgi:hypothetical protein
VLVHLLFQLPQLSLSVGVAAVDICGPALQRATPAHFQQRNRTGEVTVGLLADRGGRESGLELSAVGERRRKQHRVAVSFGPVMQPLDRDGTVVADLHPRQNDVGVQEHPDHLGPAAELSIRELFADLVLGVTHLYVLHQAVCLDPGPSAVESFGAGQTWVDRRLQRLRRHHRHPVSPGFRLTARIAPKTDAGLPATR